MPDPRLRLLLPFVCAFCPDAGSDHVEGDYGELDVCVPCFNRGDDRAYHYFDPR